MKDQLFQLWEKIKQLQRHHQKKSIQVRARFEPMTLRYQCRALATDQSICITNPYLTFTFMGEILGYNYSNMVYHVVLFTYA